MRWISLGSLWLITACGAQDFQSKKLGDGSYRFQCELPMDECVRRAQTTCQHHRFRILEGTSETRLRDAPPFEQAYHTSRLHLKCTDGDDVLLAIDKKPELPAPSPSKTCSTGETRACIGPGECKGGQSCLADGTGFGPCDCGVAARGVTTPPAAAGLDGDSAAPAPATTSEAPPAASAPPAPPLPP